MDTGTIWTLLLMAALMILPMVSMIVSGTAGAVSQS